MLPEDERLGLLLRAMRRSSGVTQRQLADLAGVPVRDIMAIEGARAGTVELDRLRRLFRAAGGNARLATWYNGAAADRLLDERHAALAERGGAAFLRWSWTNHFEVTFSEYGERGSIDLLSVNEVRLSAAVCEFKSAFGSLEETNRTLDAKARLAPKIVVERFGWRPRSIARLLIVPEDSTIRRIVAQHALTMDSLYPARGRAIRRWIRRPDGPLRGLWFLSERSR
ncbi:MAG TPA: helix-turn-helix domain-containing protein [Candidatus Limnocylindria bacterium]|nr:helix-turn-helix domain-containing protein [Candidatus Limnocylindria bacterium]